LIVLVPAAGFAQVIDTFEGGANIGSWSFGTGNGAIVNTGGNPGAYYRDTFIDSFAPRASTEWGSSSPFVGDYRSNGVTEISVDFQLFAVDFSAAGRPLTLLLTDDNGTPNDFDDDWGMFYRHQEIVPQVGEGWKHFVFQFDSASNTMPAGWNTILFGPNSPAMRLDDGAGNRQSQSHPLRSRGEERFEQAWQVASLNSGPAVRDRHFHTCIAVRSCRSAHKSALTLGRCRLRR
jgi:hypothetical protein